MDIRITQTLVNRIYSVKFETILTDDENKLVNKYSDPDVNYGGLITWDHDSNNLTAEIALYALPDNFRKLRSGTGWTQKFDGASDVNAEQKATEYARNIKRNITNVMVALRANVDTFTVVDTDTI